MHSSTEKQRTADSYDDPKAQLDGPPTLTIQAPLRNPSLQVTADHRLKAVDAPVYAPKAGEVLLHVKATGICGLPDRVSFAEGALLEPLSVALQGIREARIALGTSVAVMGAGPIGLLTLAAARASGAHPIVITDVEPARLAFAQEFVPSCQIYRVDLQKSAEENGKAIRDIFGKAEYAQPRAVLECSGVESSVCAAAFTVRRGGTVVCVGVGKSIMNNLPFMHLSLAEVEVRFINRYCDTWPAGIACIEGGLIDVKKLVSHVFPLEKAQEALEFSSDPKNGCIKVQVVDESKTIVF
ncbi:hypothetical protein Sste5346_010017 [Sporothrix stenoceras]|uniref:Alcohol dehydrogenase-like C-terminal domain-containing protein n=1 Tax=Sporothrix stenoceras TaxID=5173 RepID=A0ABR3YHV9_9PEZI